MNAGIITIGDELVSGQTTDTNSAYLARALAGVGIAVSEHSTVADDQAAIAAAVSRLAGSVDLLVVSGGLGPTDDDLTRQAVAEAIGCPLELNQACLEQIEALFHSRGWPMAETNRRQAMIPTGAEALVNSCGTAPGIALKVGSCQVFVVPGVPGEMRQMFAEHIAPRLAGGRETIVRRTIHTFGAGESSLAERIADLMDRRANPTVGTTVSDGLVSVRIVARGASPAEAKVLADRSDRKIAERLGRLVVGRDDETMAGVLGQLLRNRSATLAVAESCTGGLISKELTDLPGSSEYFLGGVVAYSNEVKQKLLDVPAELLAAHGAVSEPVAAAMAEGCRRRLGSDYALSVTGIAGPSGGSEDKPVGLVYLGLAGDGNTEVVRRIHGGDRQSIRRRAAMHAMNLLRLRLLGKE